MLGAIIGDIVGSRYEFSENKAIKDSFELFTEKSHFTDDTILSLAIAIGSIKGYGSIEDTKKEVVEYMRRLGNMYSNLKYGTKFKLWLVLNEPIPYGSYGNGAAMRVSSIAWLYNNLKDVQDYAKAVSEVTHNSKEGIIAAQAIATGIFLARQGASKEYIKKYLEEKYELDFSIFNTETTYAIDTTIASFRAFFESNSFEEAIRIAVSFGGDTDTIASMAGALAEAFYYIPEEIRIAAINKMDTQIISLYNSYLGFLDSIHSINKQKYTKILDLKTFFDKKEIIKWIPTNNRKTANFYTNYGEEVNQLIDFVKSPIFVDYDYQKTIKLLGISSFKEAIPNANMLTLRAILTSIIKRERYGIGNIGRASADGLISDILHKIDEILNYKML